MRKKKTEEKKEETKDKDKQEKEFPDTNIAIDVFSQQDEEKTEENDKKEEKKSKKKELEEKAKKLAEKFGKEITSEEIKEKLIEERLQIKEKGKTLVPLEDYIKYGCYIGTKVITPHMRPFVYRRRNDGIAIINTNLIDQKIKDMIELLVKFEPKDFIVVCKREAGWKAIEAFSRLTGVRIFTKKYPAGILTNPKLPSFFETDMVFICDPWLDKNALNDAKTTKKPVYALCDTNNYTFNVDFFIPANNKSGKSIGLIFYILAKAYLKAKKIDKEVKLEDFMSEEDSS